MFKHFNVDWKVKKKAQYRNPWRNLNQSSGKRAPSESKKKKKIGTISFNQHPYIYQQSIEHSTGCDRKSNEEKSNKKPHS